MANLGHIFSKLTIHQIRLKNIFFSGFDSIIYISFIVADAAYHSIWCIWEVRALKDIVTTVFDVRSGELLTNKSLQQVCHSK